MKFVQIKDWLINFNQIRSVASFGKDDLVQIDFFETCRKEAEYLQDCDGTVFYAICEFSRNRETYLNLVGEEHHARERLRKKQRKEAES